MMTGVFVSLPREAPTTKAPARSSKVRATSPSYARGEEVFRTSLPDRRSVRSSIAESRRMRSPDAGTRKPEQGVTYPSSPIIASRSSPKVTRFKTCDMSEQAIRTSLPNRRSDRNSLAGKRRARSPDVGTRAAEQGATYPTSPMIATRPAPNVTRFKTCDMGEQAAKTIGAVDEALRAVRSALKVDGSNCKSRLNRRSLEGSCLSPTTTASEDTESDFGAESIASTACTSTLSEDGTRHTVTSLEDSRRFLKERVQAKERSMRFTRGLLNKLSAISDTLDDVSSAP